jgi:hypothetical protein
MEEQEHFNTLQVVLNGEEVQVLQVTIMQQEEVHSMVVQEEVLGDMYILVVQAQTLQVMEEEFLSILPVVVALLEVQELLVPQVHRV